MAHQPTALAQRSREKHYFDHPDMDYYLAWIVGRQLYQGSEVGECAAVAARIVNGNAASWQSAWLQQAVRVEAQAQTLLSHGDVTKARAAYLRACTYYRAPLFIMQPQAAAFQESWPKMRACFQMAAALFDLPIEQIEVSFQGKRLLGYFWPADRTSRPCPTLIVIGGLETFAEDCYFMIGPSGRQRGYHLLTVDLPGQGINPTQGLFLEARMERAVQAVVDEALRRPVIAADRLALFGFSWGGHIVFKAAQHDQRIKALIANPAMPDVFRAALAQQKRRSRSDAIAKLVFAQIAWRMGLKLSLNVGDLARRVAKAYDYLLHGKADPRQIRCPTLCLAGEGEAPITLQIARECFAQLPHSLKNLVIFTKEEGGEAQCQVDNLALPNRVMFDWLDAVFA